MNARHIAHRLCCRPTRNRRVALRFQMMTACRRTFRCFIRAVAWIPVIFVSAVIIWGYYVYVYVMNISGVFPKGSATVSALVSALLVLIAHIILFLQLTSFIRTIFMKHKPVPEEFQLTEEQVERLEEMVDGQHFLEELSSNLPIHMLSRSGGVRYCDVCEAIKPDRCHHCSFCNNCILKMDHHCPWVNNCVGFSNYKFFVLFLFYTMLLCVWFAVTGSYDFFRAWSGTLNDNKVEKFNVIFCYFVSVLFGLSTSCLFFFHFYLVLFNRTTLENMQSPLVASGPDRRLYHLGFLRNIQLVFGRNCLRALLPVKSSEGDGVSFQTRPGRTHDCELAMMGNSHTHLSPSGGATSAPTSGEESEVEIFAAEDSERQPLTKMTQL